jgi:fatty-acyl-CoA synthase
MPETELSKQELMAYLAERLDSWGMPDDLEFVDEIPKTSVGKFSKKSLREKFAGRQLSG